MPGFQLNERLVAASAAEIVAEMERVVLGGRDAAPAWALLIGDLVGSNLRQWDLEDTSRNPSADDTVIANAKREIDRLNIGRHHMVQEIDAAFDSSLDQQATAPLATESPGMVLDRMSVLVIRRARTTAASSHDASYADRVGAVESQLAALSVAFDAFTAELRGWHQAVPSLRAPQALPALYVRGQLSEAKEPVTAPVETAEHPVGNDGHVRDTEGCASEGWGAARAGLAPRVHQVGTPGAVGRHQPPSQGGHGHAAGTPGDTVGQRPGRHFPPVGRIQDGETAAPQLLPVVVVDPSTVRSRHPQGALVVDDGGDPETNVCLPYRRSELVPAKWEQGHRTVATDCDHWPLG